MKWWDGTLNIYVFNTEHKEIRQLTGHQDFDVLRASAGKDRIVYEKGGTLWLLDIHSMEEKKVDPVSDGLYYDFNPVFTRDGEQLLFVSNRE